MANGDHRFERILLTNDDGIDAPGLKVLGRIACQLANEVWVVAPLLDQSGTSLTATPLQFERTHAIASVVSEKNASTRVQRCSSRP
ncbi:5'/3'-nucleotidase SurE [Pseudomonas sp. W3I7]|uniref:5'/3'-nucleotidase SurE n=1 Tax=Pseudomonas sp. W3I7 TaxID=3042292 RepID=UPI00278D7D33|nr:5'/3'-nucleotidase SurE [Pseudomonas sp. W3I7]